MRLSSRKKRLALVAMGVVGLAAAYLGRRFLRYEPRIEVPLATDFRIGYNLDFPGDWTNLPPFVDHFKNARSMLGVCSEADPDCDATAHLDLDERGWVKSLRYRGGQGGRYDRVEIVVNTSEDRYDIGKRFVMTWQGQGELELWGARAVAELEGQRRMTFTLARGNLVLRLHEIDPEGSGDYLRDIQIFREDHEARLRAGEVFNPDMLAFLRPFSSLRFMDWMQSNEPGRCGGGSRAGKECYAVSGEVCDGGRCVMAGKWSERPVMERALWFSSGQFIDNERPGLGAKVGGYPIELMIDLSNAIDAAPHFNVPAHFEDEYVQKLAQVVKKRLKPDLPFSVEYSNEVWNWDFPQAKYAETLGKRLWPDRGTAWVEYMAMRTHQMCKILEQELGEQESRLRCLISPQTGWRELTPDVLDCPGFSEGRPDVSSCVEHVDAINVTGYFAGCLHAHPDVIRGWLEEGREVALDRAFQQLEHGGLIPECEGDERDSLDFTIETYDYFMQLAARRGLGLEVYESGTHFEYEDDPAVKALLVALTRDARMQTLYRRNFEAFRNVGGSVFNVWGWIAPRDAWANVDSPTALDHPKYRAIVEFSQSLGQSASTRPRDGQTP